MDDGGTCSNEQGSRGSCLNVGGGEESARVFIIQVKEEVERCLAAGMSKEQMFRRLREKGLHPALTFAVYKELRDQNNGFFREYYLKIDLRKQAERLKRLLHQYRTVRDEAAAAGARALPTATPPTATAMAIPDDAVLSPEHHTTPVGLGNNACLISSSSGDDRLFAGSAPPPSTTTMHVVNGQPLHQRQQPVPKGGVHEAPSSACPSNAVMAVSNPWSLHDSVGMQWHGEQDDPVQQWWPSAIVVPSQGLNSQPPASIGKASGEPESTRAGCLTARRAVRTSAAMVASRVTTV